MDTRPRALRRLRAVALWFACVSPTGLAFPCRSESPIILDESPARVAAIAKLIPRGAVLRDVATFTTERGQKAALALWVTDIVEGATLSDPRADDVTDCATAVAGVPLEGRYHLGLILRGKLVNVLHVPGPGDPAVSDRDDPRQAQRMILPLLNSATSNHEHWGQGPPVPFDAPEGRRVAPTKILRLADYTGDGNAWEVRLVAYVASCGHLETLLAGYSAAQHRAILFPIIEGTDRLYWHDNLFGNPAEPHPRELTWRWPCGDHAAETEESETFAFDAKTESWLRMTATSEPCPR